MGVWAGECNTNKLQKSFPGSQDVVSVSERPNMSEKWKHDPAMRMMDLPVFPIHLTPNRFVTVGEKNDDDNDRNDYEDNSINNDVDNDSNDDNANTN